METRTDSQEPNKRNKFWDICKALLGALVIASGIISFIQGTYMRRENDLIMRENEHLDHNDRERQAYLMLGLKGAATTNQAIGKQYQDAFNEEKERNDKLRNIMERENLSVPPELAGGKERQFQNFVDVADVLIDHSKKTEEDQ